jgi:hypothetical protein
MSCVRIWRNALTLSDKTSALPADPAGAGKAPSRPFRTVLVVGPFALAAIIGFAIVFVRLYSVEQEIERQRAALRSQAEIATAVTAEREALAGLTTDVQARRRELAALEAERTGRTDELAGLTAKIDEGRRIEGQLTALRSELETLGRQRDALRKERDALAKERETAAVALTDAASATTKANEAARTAEARAREATEKAEVAENRASVAAKAQAGPRRGARPRRWTPCDATPPPRRRRSTRRRRRSKR